MLTPTTEQLTIITAATDTTDNLLIKALAGAAKTSTLVMIAKALPDIEILCLAFNKKIALEMQERLPDNCKAMTLNALGHRTWADATGKRLKLDKDKVYRLLTAEIELLALPAEKKAAYNNFTDLLRTIEFGKSCGYVPTDQFERAKPLMNCDEFFAHSELELSPLEEDLVRNVTAASIHESFQGIIDFNDQIFMPTIFHGSFPRYPLVLVDESQDLSALNHATLRKLVRKRIIAVGDPCQAIYGFRGAHEESMNLLSTQFSTTELTLSTSFRCSQAVVQHARWRAPNMQFPEWAISGDIINLDHWSVSDLPDSAAIICRNNGPLFRTAIRLLKNGRHSEVGGNDVAKVITKIMRKFGDNRLPVDQVLDNILLWEDTQKKKRKKSSHAGISDQAECMRIFANEGLTLGDALAYANHIINSTSPLKLLTGHKGKGLEFEHVYFLDENLLGDEGQERNLRYVIITRAKNTLTYIQSDGFRDSV